MDTSFIFSLSRNSSATDTFSSFICLKVGLAWYFLYIFFWLSTSSSEISRSPSLRSSCRSATRLLTLFRCSLHQRVNVFCWIFFHGASSARSFSVAGMMTEYSCAVWLITLDVSRVSALVRSVSELFLSRDAPARAVIYGKRVTPPAQHQTQPAFLQHVTALLCPVSSKLTRNYKKRYGKRVKTKTKQHIDN